MKRSLLAVASIFLTLSAYSQPFLEKKWDHTFGGDQREELTTIIETSDLGFLLAGFSKSDSIYDVSENSRGGNDYWIVKTDSLGNKLWDRRYGGTAEDNLFDAEQTFDGGYILAGITGSDSSGEVSEPSIGSLDFWIVKIDAFGDKQWDKRYGGTDYEWMTCIQQTLDTGYILGGWTFSDSSGDVTHPRIGGEDFWIVKTDPSGNILWDKRFGGNGFDAIYALQQTTDGGYVFGGRCSSDSGFDVSEAGRGQNDYWLVKTDANGNKLWDRRYGGSENDNFISLQQTSDGGYILGGYTLSDANGDISEPSRDTSAIINERGDMWIVKVNATGDIEWDRRFGGSWVEDAFGYVKETSDGGFLAGSASYSSMSGDKSENNFGYEQSWIVKMDAAGNKLWDKTIFVSREDEYAYPIQTSDGCYVIANYSEGDSAAYKTENSRGDYDFWFVKFCETLTPQLPVANFIPDFNYICEGGCFSFTNFSLNSASFEWQFPGAVTTTSTITSPTGICYTDTGQYSVTLIAISLDGNDTLTLNNVITVLPLPVFTITRSDDTLFAPTGYSGYQWFRDTIALPNDTNYFYVATQNGTYAVQVTDTADCPATQSITILNVGIENNLYNTSTIILYPNPVREMLTIKGLNNVAEGLLTVTDVLGQELLSAKINSSEYTLHVENYNPGIYFVTAAQGDKKYFSRFIVN